MEKFVAMVVNRIDMVRLYNTQVLIKIVTLIHIEYICVNGYFNTTHDTFILRCEGPDLVGIALSKL